VIEPTCGPIEFIEAAVLHPKGRWYGSPFKLEEWQRQIVHDLFFTKQPDGLRQYRTAYVSVPRKNGKTTLAAGIALYWLLEAGEPGSEIYSLAGDTEQARIAFEMARKMVEQNPRMEAACKVYRNAIVVPATGAHYKVMSSEAAGKHGYSPDLVIFDELHVQRDRELWDVMRTGMGARQQPLMLAITTAGIFDKTSIAWEVYDYACKVRDGIVEDDTFYTAIWEAGKDEDWTDPAVWAAANPNLGVTVPESFLQQECAAAKETPSYQSTFRRLYLNQWTEQATRWLDMTTWDACDGPPQLDPDLPTYGALDLSTTTDISAWVLVQVDADGVYHVVPTFWVPAESITRRSRKDAVPYDAWRRDGYVLGTPGNVVDYSAIRKRVNEDAKKYRVVEIAYDPWNATQLAVQLQEEDGLHMTEFRQGWVSMNEPTKELEKLAVDGRLRHGGHPALRWMASNVTVKEDPAGNLKPDKAKSTERIDGIVATIMGIGLAMVRTDKRSRYETEELLVI